MSYMPLEWVQPMTKERWGRLVEDQESGGGSGLVWAPNNRPLELANEYLALAKYAQLIERELTSSTRMLNDIGTRLADLSASSIADQVKKSKLALDATPSEEKVSEPVAS